MRLLKESADFADDTFFFMQKLAANNCHICDCLSVTTTDGFVLKDLRHFFLELFYDNYCNFILN
jgi:hypothetical protein